MAQSPAQSRSGQAHRGGRVQALRRALPEETPVALCFDGTTLAVMMASPSDISDFAHGFALGEGVITSLDQVSGFEAVAHDTGIEARFWLSSDRGAALAARRRAMMGPVGCGLCGIDSLAAALRDLPRVTAPAGYLAAADVAGASEALRALQPLHDKTRAVHAAGFLLPGQGVVLAREDVGRHNALDKLIGAMARQGIAPEGGAVVMTSRISVELVQKCALAGIACLIAVSAPTALALRMAETAGITIAAFARDDSFELFSHPDRISDEAPHVA
ncbi:formate dehydrogenase accessory sulfurtransferase FdhD [Pseudooceanicola aestuarii]|uniref:formate dehydrogenase accessory sulfurtransferase FdhD n=1 Tax=Pseudooceanicola aestuarii TaxID=2697319 RepID=UPI0013D18346|nr:formate dehydrogenase accessory sulfurtransferase FdhD [Pseudooceanicola aestuarii]